MKELFKLIVVCLVGTNLVACTSLLITPPGAPPKTVIVEVNLSSVCTTSVGIETQTTQRSCDYVGPDDPANIACQKASTGGQARFIEWKLVTETKPLPEFTLEFKKGHPFTRACRISKKNSSFKCKIRNNTRSNPLKTVYKYDVVFSQTCRLDPRIYLRR